MSNFAKFRQGVREKVTTALGRDGGTEEDDTADPTPEEVEKEEEETRRHEYRLMIILEKVRDIYFQRKLIGSVDISRSFLAAGNSVSCDVDGSGEPDPPLPIDGAKEDQKIPMLAKVAINSATRLLNRLEIRAKNYRGKVYRDDLTISGSISITDPLGLTSVCISCSASVTSLLVHSGEHKS